MPQDGESSPYQPPQCRALPCIPALCTAPPTPAQALPVEPSSHAFSHACSFSRGTVMSLLWQEGLLQLWGEVVVLYFQMLL